MKTTHQTLGHPIRLRLGSLRAGLAAALSLGACAAVFAQQPSVFATGLQFPSKIILGPTGTLLVTETGATPNSGRVSIIDSGGSRRTLLDGLPSGLAAPALDPDGPNGLALDGRTLFIANGEGDTHRTGPKPGTIVPNPTGPSSPIFSTILQVTFSGDVNLLASGFSLQPQDHYALLDGNTVMLTNASGDTASIQVLAAFRPDIPDPRTIYRNSHLYGITLLATHPGFLYVADAGRNSVVQVDVSTGRTKTLAHFPSLPNPLPFGPPLVDAVPDSIRAFGHHLLVSHLTGVPFAPGLSRVMALDPVSGTASVFIRNLSSAIDIAVRPREGNRPIFYVLEYSTGLSKQPLPAGRLLRYSTELSTVFVDGLKTPTSIAVDDATGTLYITDRSDGTVLTVPDPGN